MFRLLIGNYRETSENSFNRFMKGICKIDEHSKCHGAKNM
jgi:hypothetical protein